MQSNANKHTQSIQNLQSNANKAYTKNTKFANKFQARLREMVTYEDLEEETTTKSTVLKIKDKNQFCRGIAVETSQVNSETKVRSYLTTYGVKLLHF